jgi:PAS domain S-box-containing protein
LCSYKTMPENPVQILLVEDSPSDALLVREALRAASLHFRLSQAERLGEGIERLGARRFDLVLLDLGLPDSYGLETLAAVQRQARGVPVVVLTGTSDEALALRAVQQGAQDYLVKGQAEGQVLARSIRYAIERKQAERQLAVQYIVTDILANSATLAEAASDILQTICKNLEWEVGEFWTVDCEACVLRRVETWQSPSMQCVSLEPFSRQRTLSPGVGLPGRVWVSGEPVWIVDIVEYFNFARASVGATGGLHAAVAFPVRVGGEVEAVMGFFSPAVRQPDEGLLKTMAGIGSQVGQFVERWRAKQALRESEERYRTLAETATDAIISIDEDSKILFVNPAAEKVFGYTSGEMLGQPLTLLMPEYLRQIHRAALERYTRTGKRHVSWNCVELPGLHKSGREIPLELSFGECIKGDRHFFTGVVRDVTERKRAEEAVRTSNQTLRALIQASPLAILVVDGDGKVTLWSPGAERLFGWAEPEVLGRPLPTIPADKQEEFRAWRQAVLQGDSFVGLETQRLRKDGSLIDVSIWTAPLRDGKGEVNSVMNIVADITGRKQAEEQVRASLREKEVMLKEIHHRVKNNLQIVSSLLSLQSGYLKDSQALESFQEVQNRVQSMAMIHENLYQSKDLARVDFAEYILSLTAHLFHSYGANPEDIRLEVNIASVLLDVNTAILCGLITNELVSNCLKYAFPGGRKGLIRIELCAENQDKDPGFQLIVSDDGVGMPKDSACGRNGSLGLQLVRRMAQQLGGMVELRGDAGTKFNIRFKQ